MQKRIPPITLQLLIENAIKHNVASEAKPLTITLFAANNTWLVITCSVLSFRHIVRVLV